MKKIILSKTKKQQIINKQLTQFEVDYNDPVLIPVKSNGRNRPSGVFTQEGKTWVSLRWVANQQPSDSPLHHVNCRYTEGETYILDGQHTVKMEKIELLQRENIFYWWCTVSLIES